MIRHLFKLLWHQRRAQAPLLLLLALTYGVLFGVGSVAGYYWRNYRVPLGFAYRPVWRLDFGPGAQPRSGQPASWHRVLARLRAVPGLVSLTRSAENTPFALRRSSTQVRRPGGAPLTVQAYAAGPELAAVLGLQLREGRWFDERADTAATEPVVLNEQLRARLFAPGQPAVGQLLYQGTRPRRVVGVCGAYRAGGEFSAPEPVLLNYVGPRDSLRGPWQVLVRVRPGAGAALQQRLVAAVRAASPQWSCTIRPLAALRRTRLQLQLGPLLALAVVGVFLLGSAGLGLFGALQLAGRRRRAELGVRRALGATRGTIQRQLLGEVLVLTTFSLALAVPLAAQFPLLDLLGVAPAVYWVALARAAGGLYLLAAACALYPGWQAARTPPAAALREE